MYIILYKSKILYTCFLFIFWFIKLINIIYVSGDCMKLDVLTNDELFKLAAHQGGYNEIINNE